MTAPIETDALVIGAGPVGLFQVFQLGLLEVSCHIVDALPYAGGQCIELYPDKPIYDIPGTPATTGRALVASLLEQIAPFSPQFHFGQLVSTMVREPDGRFRVGTSTGTLFLARTVIVAGGVGAFRPKRIVVEGIERFEGTQLAYHPERLDAFVGKQVVVNGGDDTALEAAIALAEHTAGCVTLVHRRDGFQADDVLVQRMRALCDAGAMHFVVGQITAFAETNGTLKSIAVTRPDTSVVNLNVDTLLAFLGVSPRLGPIADWGLDLVRKQVPVDTERFQTREAGVFAVGDLNTYPGKKKLIVCGFHEATLAAWGALSIAHPERRPLLQYTTTSTRLHELLGVGRP
jgi:thioredoxin reductase (NADPH)